MEKRAPLIARKSDIYHKIEMGILFDAYYDTETTDLDKRFAEISQFGGVITDLAGNILHHVDLRAKISPYTVISPFAWLVQRMRASDVQSGEPRSIFMGKVKRFFEYSNQLYRAPFSEKFLMSCQKGVYKNGDGKEEGYYSYPVLADDGILDWDFIRIHESLKKFYFKDSSGNWQKRDIKSLSIGYNNINADDQWLWTQGFMAGLENIFITHMPKNGQYRLDALRVVEALYCLGGEGENGLKVPFQENGAAGKPIPSLSLGKVLAINTRYRSDIRGITEGVELEDGSHVDLTQLHGALQDALALRGLMLFLRKHHAGHLAQMEKNSDWKYVIDRMTEVNGSFGVSPPLAYIDKTYPVIDGKMVSLIGTDQHRNAPKVAVVWNLNVDPKTYSYNGRNISELGEDDWKKILEESRSNPNAPLKVIKVHKSVRLFPAEDGYAAGFNRDMDRQEIYARIVALKKSRGHARIMSALRLAYPRIFGVDRMVMPQLEEELFTFSTLELFDADAGEDVQIHTRVQNRVEMIAQKSRSHIMKVKALWMKAIQFDEDVLLEEGKNPDAMAKKIEALNKELRKLDSPLIPEPDGPLSDKKDAFQYKIKILIYARNYFAQGALQDIGHHFWFEDSDGIRYSDKDIRQWPQDRMDKALNSGELGICHENINTTPLLIDRIIEELGYTHLLGEDVERQLDAYKKLRRFGLPHYHGQSCRWYTVDAARRDVSKIELNEVNESELAALDTVLPGLWTQKMQEHHDSGLSLEEYKSYLDTLGNDRISKDVMPYVGLDPQTGYPSRRSDFEVSEDGSLVIDVPDRYLEQPSIDTVNGRAIWILPLQEAFRQVVDEEEIDGVILRAAFTRRMYHLPTAKLVPLPPKGGAYKEMYNQVANSYAESAQELCQNTPSMALVGNGPFPIHNIRKYNRSAQTLHIERERFEGMVAPDLAGYDTGPSGIIIRDDNLKLEKGAVRLRELSQMAVTGWELETDITDVREVTLNDIYGFTEKELLRYGFRTIDEAVDFFGSLFTKQRKEPRNSKNKAWAIAFGDIAPDDPDRGMMYFKPDERIFSRFVPNP